MGSRKFDDEDEELPEDAESTDEMVPAETINKITIIPKASDKKPVADGDRKATLAEERRQRSLAALLALRSGGANEEENGKLGACAKVTSAKSGRAKNSQRAIDEMRREEEEKAKFVAERVSQAERKKSFAEQMIDKLKEQTDSRYERKPKMPPRPAKEESAPAAGSDKGHGKGAGKKDNGKRPNKKKGVKTGKKKHRPACQSGGQEQPES